jgi:predicted nucleotidyltransferase
MNLEPFLDGVARWATAERDIDAVALVGSHASGEARPNSDVDLMILTSKSSRYFNDVSWTKGFGAVLTSASEHYGRVKSVRVRYDGGLEVEFAFAPLEWADTEPADADTVEIVSRGMVIVADKSGSLGTLQSISQASHQSH